MVNVRTVRHATDHDGRAASVLHQQGLEIDMECVHHRPDSEVIERRRQLAPGPHEAFLRFSKEVFADGALPEKTKQLIAVAVAHVTPCPHCITGHTRIAARRGATPEEIMEAIWVADEMRAGAAYAHSLIAVEALDGASSGTMATAGSPDADRAAG
jgi:AhpD family alkylhydroperoxidase